MPLGPNDRPLNGLYISQNYPFNNTRSTTYTTTTTATKSTTTSTIYSITTTSSDEGLVMGMLNTIRQMSFQDRRRMFVTLVLTVPMTALTLTAIGVPSLLVAPMATIIPVFLYIAYTNT